MPANHLVPEDHPIAQSAVAPVENAPVAPMAPPYPGAPVRASAADHRDGGDDTAEGSQMASPPSYDEVVPPMPEKHCPEPAITFSLLPEITAAAASATATILCDARCKATSLAVTQKRPRLDCVLVIDVSGSMSGSKLTLSKKTLELAINDAQPDDRIGLVTYSDKATVLLPLTKMSQHNRAMALSIVDTIQARGSTALAAGLVTGLRVAQGVSCDDDGSAAEVVSVLLCTDGHANRGPQQASAIIEAMRDPWAHSPEGIAPYPEAPSEKAQTMALTAPSLYTFGFGANHDSELLQSLADAGGGVYYHVESADKIAESFADAIGGLSSTVAKGVRLEFEAGPNARITKLWTAFDHCVAADGQTGWVKVQDVQESEVKDVLVSLELDPVTASDLPPIEPCLRARCAFVDITGSQPVPQCTATAISITRPAVAAPAVRNPEIREQWARLRTSEVIRESNERAKRGAIPEAREMVSKVREEVRTVAAEIKAAGGGSSELLDSIDLDYEVCLDGLSSMQRYEQLGKHRIRQKAAKHGWQRSCEGEDNFYSQSTSRMTKKTAWRG